MPQLETDVHQPLLDTDYRPLGVHTGNDVRFAVQTGRDTGITFPMLIDYDSSILAVYKRPGEGVILFPLAYLLDRDLTVDHVYVEEEPPLATLLSHIQALLDAP